MRAYIIRRLLLLAPTVLLTSLLVFFVAHILPGDIVDAMIAAGSADVQFDRSMLERQLGLDKPLLFQFGRWLGVVPQADGLLSGVLQGNLGVSWWTRLPVVQVMALKWPVTLELGVMAMIIAQLIALPIGIYSAIRQDTWGDYAARSFAILSISVPSFWLGWLVVVFPSIWWGYMPPIMLVRFSQDPIGNLQMFLVPAVVLGLGLCGLTMRMTRAMMLEVLRQDYIRTAWAKGLREGVVTVRHALKNALIPVITLVGLQVPMLVGGAVIIEQIFVLPGIGRALIGAVLNRDYPLISGIMFVVAAFLILVNLGVDLAYAYLDPRIRYRTEGGSAKHG